MPFYANYADLTALRGLLGKTATDTADDVRLRTVGESVSRLIDNYCRRHFGVKAETRYFEGRNFEMHQLWVDDLLSITSLTADYDADGTAEETLTATYYLLWPYNSWPKQRIDLNLPKSPNYTYWPTTQRSVTITGTWGYGDGESATPYFDSTSTVTVGTTSGTSVTASSGTPFSVGNTIRAGSEDMYITAIATNTLTVVRGVNGTTAEVQAAAKAYIHQAPGPVREAALLQSARAFMRKGALFGVVGASEMGQVLIPTKLDPDVALYLTDYRRF